MLEQTLRAEFPELGDQPLNDEQIAVYCKKLRQRRQRRSYRPEPPIEAYEPAMAR
jgi:hypothetical protein